MWSRAMEYDGEYVADAALRGRHATRWNSVVGVPVTHGYGAGPAAEWCAQAWYGGGQIGVVGTPLHRASPVYSSSSWQLPGMRWAPPEVGPYGGALTRAPMWGPERLVREENRTRLESFGPPVEAHAASARVDGADWRRCEPWELELVLAEETLRDEPSWELREGGRQCGQIGAQCSAQEEVASWLAPPELGLTCGSHGEGAREQEHPSVSADQLGGSVSASTGEVLQSEQGGKGHRRTRLEPVGTSNWSKIILSSPDVLDQEMKYAECGILGKAFAPAARKQAVEDGIVKACGKKPLGISMYTLGKFQRLWRIRSMHSEC